MTDFCSTLFWVLKGKDGIWTRAWKKSTCRISSPVPYQAEPPFQDAEKGIWTLTPEWAHAPEACVSAVPPPPHSSIIHFLGKMPRKKREAPSSPFCSNIFHIRHVSLRLYPKGSFHFVFLTGKPTLFLIFWYNKTIKQKGVRFARNHRQGLGWLLLRRVRRSHLPDTGSWKL